MDAGSLASDLLELARSLGATAQDIEDVSSGRRNPADLLWGFLEARRDWLLIIDNADDPEALTVHGRTARDNSGWIRPTSAGLVLITSRNIDPMAWGRHVTIHTVGWLPERDGAGVLMDLAPHAGTPDEARALSERLGGLPLALRHAGFHLASPFNRERSFSAYAAALNDRFPELMGAGGDDRTIVTSTWRLTLDALSASGTPEADAMIRILSTFAGGVPIRVDLLDHEILARACGLLDSSRVASSLRALANTGLITHASMGPDAAQEITLHPLVVETLQFGDVDREPHEDTALELITAAVQALEPRNPEHLAAWTSLVPHISKLLRATSSRDGSALVTAAEAGHHIAVALGWASLYFAAIQLVEDALTATASLGDEHQAVLDLKLGKAKATRLIAHSAAAEPIIREVVEARERSLGSDDLETVYARYELGLCLQDQRKIAEAEQEYRKVLATRRNVLGDDHPDTLIVRQALALIPYRLRQLTEAERALREVHAAQLRILGGGHPNTLTTRKFIAVVLVRAGRYDEAEREILAILPTMRDVWGSEHGHVLSLRHELAETLVQSGRTRKVRGELADLLSVERRVLGAEHPLTRRTVALLEGLEAHRRT
ncbi:tetratricopeptide repeat-containing protein [Actinomadura soli]|uniref:Tetratricopeptide repeat-containing protein n=1 Tax=Actinomadura soli TaxID=2508997 RepID=A0A5C4IZR1_9ACTN|nr:tetratricopeptide repeat protein [Actinomadura soli]TMQ89807.1 tetratricopeptide repeat-containing protein [Actinomadura soli]